MEWYFLPSYNSFPGGFLYLCEHVVFMRITNVRLPEEMVEKLDRIASSMLMSRSEVIRHAISMYMILIEHLGEYVRPSTLLFRDLRVRKDRNSVIFDMGNNMAITIHSFSYGGIGEKELDSVKAGYDLVGEVISRQAIVEALSRNITPVSAIINFTCDLADGKKMLRPMYRNFEKVGVGGNRVYVTSSEELSGTVQSGVSLSLVGAGEPDFLENRAKSGDAVLYVGEPVHGMELVQSLEKIISIETIQKLAGYRREGIVNEIVPVKSDGLNGALSYLASSSGNQLVIERPVTGMEKGGPATSLLISCKEKYEDRIKREFNGVIIARLI